MWLPSNASSNWSPVNLLNVHSRGTETHTELHYFKNNFQMKWMVNTAYTLSTNKKTINENDNSLNRQ